MYKRILVPVDGSPTSLSGLQEAIKLAKALNARLCLLHVVDLHVVYMDIAGADRLAQCIAILKDHSDMLLAEAKSQVDATGVAVETYQRECVAPAVAQTILQVAAEWSAELIVMGTHGRRGLSHLIMGSNAERVLRDSDIPVLLSRHQPNHAVEGLAVASVERMST
ncbi:universal stress protein [Chitinimonas sp. PSY-7]|uniref:universal stress protein n=1 Tax=Chitinimonas sp. PSY-7 TaxID=3459088 RepID=UPI00403FEB44